MSDTETLNRIKNVLALLDRMNFKIEWLNDATPDNGFDLGKYTAITMIESAIDGQAELDHFLNYLKGGVMSTSEKIRQASENSG